MVTYTTGRKGPTIPQRIIDAKRDSKNNPVTPTYATGRKGPVLTPAQIDAKRYYMKNYKKQVYATGRKRKESKRRLDKIKKVLKERVPHRTIIKKQDVRLTLPDIHRQNMWNDPNRFFKSEMEETKKSMFLR